MQMQIGWSWREKIFEETNLKLDHHHAIWSRCFNVGGRLMCTTPIVLEVLWDRLLLWRTGIALDCHSRRYCKIALRQRQRVRGRMFFCICRCKFYCILHFSFYFVCIFCNILKILQIARTQRQRVRGRMFLYFVFLVIVICFTLSKYCKLYGGRGNVLEEECINRELGDDVLLRTILQFLQNFLFRGHES